MFAYEKGSCLTTIQYIPKPHQNLSTNVMKTVNETVIMKMWSIFVTEIKTHLPIEGACILTVSFVTGL